MKEIYHKIYPTFTFPYFHVKNTTKGKQQIITHERIRITVRITQFKETTHGRSSSHDSQPSGQGKHSNIPSFSYWLVSP